MAPKRRARQLIVLQLELHPIATNGSRRIVTRFMSGDIATDQTFPPVERVAAGEVIGIAERKYKTDGRRPKVSLVQGAAVVHYNKLLKPAKFLRRQPKRAYWRFPKPPQTMLDRYWRWINP